MEQNYLFGIEEDEQQDRYQRNERVVSMDMEQSVLYAKANEKKAGRGLSPRRLMEKFSRQGFRCFFSGLQIDRQDASIDHVHPISKGGKHEEQNIELVHAVINRMKGSLTAGEFIAWCVKVAIHSGGCQPPDWQESQKWKPCHYEKVLR